MDAREIMILGLGLKAPWQLVSQQLDTNHIPHELHLEVKAERGAKYPCPECEELCPAHDFREKVWRHLNFFQHHCYIHAMVPRVKCPEHGIKLVKVPWARKGSAFTLLFEQASLALCREMPVRAASRIIEENDKRLWRIVFHYVREALETLDCSLVRGIGLDETSSKSRHQYVTVFIDMNRKKNPVLFVTPGKGKATIARFKAFLRQHGGKPEEILEVVCDMSKAFLSGIKEHFPGAKVTVDWFHIVQTFTKALNEVMKKERATKALPKHLRWAALKRCDVKNLTDHQVLALGELLEKGLETAVAWRIKENLAGIRLAKTPRAAKWRITRFIHKSLLLTEGSKLLEPMVRAIETLRNHKEEVAQRWTSTFTNARLEGLNGIFQAAKARARGYRNVMTFITMIYLIASPVAEILKGV